MTTFDPTKHVFGYSVGHYGRFGNQLFQIAATIAHANRLGLEPVFRADAWSNVFLMFDGIDRRMFCITNVRPEHTETMRERPWNYEPISDDVRILHGYFQSPLFWNRGPLGKRRYDPPFKLRPVGAALHTRHGDYELLPEHHPALPGEYYETALTETFPSEKTESMILHTGDDPNWMTEDWRLISDFYALAAAPVLVIANSTFSLWAAYLGAASKVYYPRPWFGPALAHLEAGQLIPPNTPEKTWRPIDWR